MIKIEEYPKPRSARFTSVNMPSLSTNFMALLFCNDPPWQGHLTKRRALLALLTVLCGGLLSCGYTLVGAPPKSGVGPVSVSVPPVLNESREPGLESRMTTALRQTIVHHPQFSLHSHRQAVHRLNTTVRDFRAIAISFDASDTVVQFRIEAKTSIRLVRQETEEPLIEQDIDTWAEYLISPDGRVRENVIARNAAIFRLARQFADKCAALIEISLL